MIRLAVVDDHPAVRLSFVDFLDAQDDFRVVGQAETGLQAVELCREETVDAVLMDVRMPVMDGIEATRLIKSISPNTRVVLVTAYEQDELRDAGFEAGADLFLTKGVSGAEVAERLREFAS
jgi:DNA-binding NarL/FixJ family response regulator